VSRLIPKQNKDEVKESVNKNQVSKGYRVKGQEIRTTSAGARTGQEIFQNGNCGKK